mgnify:CR=1 FL=1|jgi:hypothetical protein
MGSVSLSSPSAFCAAHKIAGARREAGFARQRPQGQRPGVQVRIGRCWLQRTLFGCGYLTPNTLVLCSCDGLRCKSNVLGTLSLFLLWLLRIFQEIDKTRGNRMVLVPLLLALMVLWSMAAAELQCNARRLRCDGRAPCLQKENGDWSWSCGGGTWTESNQGVDRLMETIWEPGEAWR